MLSRSMPSSRRSAVQCTARTTHREALLSRARPRAAPRVPPFAQSLCKRLAQRSATSAPQRDEGEAGGDHQGSPCGPALEPCGRPFPSRPSCRGCEESVLRRVRAQTSRERLLARREVTGRRHCHLLLRRVRSEQPPLHPEVLHGFTCEPHVLEEHEMRCTVGPRVILGRQHQNRSARPSPVLPRWPGKSAAQSRHGAGPRGARARPESSVPSPSSSTPRNDDTGADPTQNASAPTTFTVACPAGSRCACAREPSRSATATTAAARPALRADTSTSTHGPHGGRAHHRPDRGSGCPSRSAG